MSTHPGFLACAVLLAATFAAPALATTVVPSAAQSSVDPVLVGDSNGMQIGNGFRVTVRDALGNAMANSTVILSFAGAPARPYDVQVAPALVSCPNIASVTDVLGGVVFRPRLGGFANTKAVVVYADGIPLATVLARSTDINGDGVTGMRDLELFRFNYLEAPNAQETDFDQSGRTDLGDFDLFRRVYLSGIVGATCP